MVYKACTFGLEEGPCHELPSVAVWRSKATKRRIWTCPKHDKTLDQNLRKAQARSGFTRQAIGTEGRA